VEVAAIVAEYNPFHKGHAYQVARTREAGADCVIAVMSGNFVQRCEGAMIDKRARAEMALRGGVDLVVELPLPWATASAERFAFGAVSLAHATGIVTRLSFGSECGDAQLLMKAAKLVAGLDGDTGLKEALREGDSFPAARERALACLTDDEAVLRVLRSPNDILGVEYCKALLSLASPVVPYAVRRVGAGHDSAGESEGYLSASALRGRLMHSSDSGGSGVFLPAATREIIEREREKGHAPADFHALETAVLADLRKRDKDYFLRLPDVSEGLENRLADAACAAASLADLYARVKTKRYTLSRVRRVVLAAFLEVLEEYAASPPPYIRVLGFNGRGRELLGAMKRSAALPVVTRYKEIAALPTRARELFALEARATAVYNLSLPAKRPGNTEYTDQTVILD
jgi:predicted nucleotidyltransferase